MRLVLTAGNVCDIFFTDSKALGCRAAVAHTGGILWISPYCKPQNGQGNYFFVSHLAFRIHGAITRIYYYSEH